MSTQDRNSRNGTVTSMDTNPEFNPHDEPPPAYTAQPRQGESALDATRTQNGWSGPNGDFVYPLVAALRYAPSNAANSGSSENNPYASGTTLHMNTSVPRFAAGPSMTSPATAHLPRHYASSGIGTQVATSTLSRTVSGGTSTVPAHITLNRNYSTAPRQDPTPSAVTTSTAALPVTPRVSQAGQKTHRTSGRSKAGEDDRTNKREDPRHKGRKYRH